MKRGNFGIQVIVFFIGLLVAYLIVYSLIQKQRFKEGPWTVTFTNESGQPSLLISQTNLALHDVRISFTNAPVATNITQTIDFGTARGVPFPVPFGECVFFDARFLPGTVVFNLYGHEIQLLPRVLTIDRVELPWKSGDVILLGTGSITNATLPKGVY